MHFWGSVWNCIRFDFISVFFVCVLFQWKKIYKINTWVPKKFATATIFWENGCLFWQNCKVADIFGHGCILYITSVRCIVFKSTFSKGSHTLNYLNDTPLNNTNANKWCFSFSQLFERWHNLCIQKHDSFEVAVWHKNIHKYALMCRQY